MGKPSVEEPLSTSSGYKYRTRLRLMLPMRGGGREVGRQQWRDTLYKLNFTDTLRCFLARDDTSLRPMLLSCRPPPAPLPKDALAPISQPHSLPLPLTTNSSSTQSSSLPLQVLLLLLRHHPRRVEILSPLPEPAHWDSENSTPDILRNSTETLASFSPGLRWWAPTHHQHQCKRLPNIHQNIPRNGLARSCPSR